MIRVSVAIALPDRQEVVELDLPDGATIARAIEAANLEERFLGTQTSSLEAGVWGVRAGRETILREGDRVELYRALKADPKDQRRRRAKP